MQDSGDGVDPATAIATQNFMPATGRLSMTAVPWASDNGKTKKRPAPKLGRRPAVEPQSFRLRRDLKDDTVLVGSATARGTPETAARIPR